MAGELFSDPVLAPVDLDVERPSEGLTLEQLDRDLRVDAELPEIAKHGGGRIRNTCRS